MTITDGDMMIYGGICGVIMMLAFIYMELKRINKALKQLLIKEEPK